VWGGGAGEEVNGEKVERERDRKKEKEGVERGRKRERKRELCKCLIWKGAVRAEIVKKLVSSQRHF
jgi:hypothetical protein